MSETIESNPERPLNAGVLTSLVNHHREFLAFLQKRIGDLGMLGLDVEHRARGGIGTRGARKWASARAPVENLIRSWHPIAAYLATGIMVLSCSSDTLAPDRGPDPAASGAAAPHESNDPAPSSSGPTNSDSPSAADFGVLPDYPSGPYGRGEGAVIDNLRFIGWRHPREAGYEPALLEPVTLADFYDPSGQSTKLLVLNASAVWCVVCQAEMAEIKRKDIYARYRERGVEFLGTLFEDQNGNPAKPSDLVLWGSAAARSIEFPLVLDPSLSMGIYFTSDATPLNLLIDSQTMRIVHVAMGYDGSESGFWSIIDHELTRRGISPP